MDHAPAKLEVQRISKSFGHVVALSNVSFSISCSEVLAVAGGNGAGKSTLLKIIAGAITPDSGSVTFDGRTLELGNAHKLRATGIEMVFQDCGLCPDASVLDNLYLGSERITKLGFLRLQFMRVLAHALIFRYGLPI